MRIGYGRVSTRDQHPDAQADVLAAAGWDEVFVGKASGTLARRPELDKALLAANRTGEQLVVTKLDRLGRSLEHLIELSKQADCRGCAFRRVPRARSAPFVKRICWGFRLIRRTIRRFGD